MNKTEWWNLKRLVSFSWDFCLMLKIKEWMRSPVQCFHAVLQQQSICSLLTDWLSSYLLIMHFTEQTHLNKARTVPITNSTLRGFTWNSLQDVVTLKMIYVLSVWGGPDSLKTLLFDNPAFVQATIDQRAVRVMIWCCSGTQNADRTWRIR